MDHGSVAKRWDTLRIVNVLNRVCINYTILAGLARDAPHSRKATLTLAVLLTHLAFLDIGTIEG